MLGWCGYRESVAVVISDMVLDTGEDAVDVADAYAEFGDVGDSGGSEGDWMVTYCCAYAGWAFGWSVAVESGE